MQEEYSGSGNKNTKRTLFYFFLFVGANIILWAIFITNFQTGSLSNISAREIEPGTSLISYEGNKVSCTFHFVLNRIDEYNTGDGLTSDTGTTVNQTTDTIKTDVGTKGTGTTNIETGTETSAELSNIDIANNDKAGYLVLDDNLKNPFMVYVQTRDIIQMDAMMEETKKVIAGETQFHPAGSMTIKGFVERSPYAYYYNNSLSEDFNDYKISNAEVFYIGDANLEQFKKYSTKNIIILMVYLILLCADIIIIFSFLKICLSSYEIGDDYE